MQKTYRVIDAAPSGEPDDDRTGIYVDDLKGQRCLLETGTTFTAELDTEKIPDKRFRHLPEPRFVDTGRPYVVSADIDVKPGCLTSLIATGRAVDVAIEPKKQPKKPAKKGKK